MSPRSSTNSGQIDYYRLLGVDPKADLAAIRDAFHRHALNLHPDVTPNPEDHERFRLVNDAYRVLSDPGLRKRYDALRLLGFGIPLGRLGDFLDDPQRLRFVLEKAEKVFAAASGLVRKNPATAGRDLVVETSVSFEESFTGAKRSFHYGRETDCEDCGGKGYAVTQTCAFCKGEGRLPLRWVPGVYKRCPRCGAKGWIGQEVCAACEGRGRKMVPHDVRVQVPAGVADNRRLRVRGHGEAGRMGGRDGDLIVKVAVGKSAVAARHGNDLVVPLEVDFPTAALGGVAKLELPDGKTLGVRVPPWSWDERRIRARGKGFPDPVTGSRGDLFAVVKILFPDQVDEETRRMVLHYCTTVHGHQDAKKAGFKEQLEEHFAKASRDR